VDACEYGDKLSGSKNEGNFLTSWETVSFAERTVLQGVSQSVWHGGTPLTRDLPTKNTFNCIRPHKHRENADIHLCPDGNQNPNPGHLVCSSHTSYSTVKVFSTPVTSYTNYMTDKIPYFSIDNTHPKLFRHSFWCIDNARDANLL
jgi:hypothetical protein